MGCCSVQVSAKFIMFCLSVLFWCVSAGLMYLSIEMFRYVGNIHTLTSNYFLTIPASVTIGLSLLFLVVGLCGCISVSRKDAKCLKSMFIVLLLIILLMEITGAVLAIVYKDEVNKGIETGINKTMATYGSSENSNTTMDYLQSHLHCCGIHSYEDWFDTPWGMNTPSAVPESCCMANESTCTGHLPSDKNKINTKGCHDKLYSDLRKYLVYIITIGVVFALIQTLALICTCILLRKKKETRYTQLESPTREESSYGYKA